MEKKESQSWFLIKEDWSKWLFNLSDEEAGKFIKAIYSGEVPSGVIGVLYQSHHDEFTRVNQKRVEFINQAVESGVKGAKLRWYNHAIKNDKGNNRALTKDYRVESHTDTDTDTDTDTVIDKNIEYNNKIDEIFNIENLK